MDVSNWIRQAAGLGYSALSQASDAMGAGVGFVQSSLGATRLFGSTEASRHYDHEKVDEKHYFLIPDRLSEADYSIYIMRCLPDGVPPINDLPKHRLFHLPNAHAMPTLEHILVSEARGKAEDTESSVSSISGRLNELADHIDRLDGKVFNGVLLIGGLVALINPLAGAAVAMKGLLPSIGMLISKYGLKYASETANSMEMGQRIKSAEKDVLSQFRGAGTDSLVNPLLTQLDHALATQECEYEPILNFEPSSMSFGEHDRTRLYHLTCQAVANTYDRVIDEPKHWDAANLGPEDIRFLKVLREIAIAT